MAKSAVLAAAASGGAREVKASRKVVKSVESAGSPTLGKLVGPDRVRWRLRLYNAATPWSPMMGESAP